MKITKKTPKAYKPKERKYVEHYDVIYSPKGKKKAKAKATAAKKKEKAAEAAFAKKVKAMKSGDEIPIYSNVKRKRKKRK